MSAVEIEVPDEVGIVGVYVFLDEKNEPLYIGRSTNVLARTLGHKRTADWWPRVRGFEWTPCESMAEARAVEKSMIATFRPDSNTNDIYELGPSKVSLPKWAADHLRRMLDEEPRSGVSGSELTAYIHALRSVGWTLHAIGEPIAFSREAVRLRGNRASSYDGPLPPAPLVPPTRPFGPVPPKRVPAQVPEDIAARMRALYPVAMRRRSNNNPVAVAACDELNNLIVDQMTSGVSAYMVARACEVTVGAVELRLRRYGWKPVYPSAPTLTGAKKYVPKTHCASGHELSGDNVRFINGDSRYRRCRPCERRRSAEYKARKHALATT